MKKECGYCHKPVEEGAEVKSTLLYLNVQNELEAWND